MVGRGCREARAPPPRGPASEGAGGFLQVDRLQMVVWGAAGAHSAWEGRDTSESTDTLAWGSEERGLGWMPRCLPTPTPNLNPTPILAPEQA